MNINRLNPTIPLTEIIHNHNVEKKTLTNTIEENQDPFALALNQEFYQLLQSQCLNNTKDILKLLEQFDFKDNGNQTLRESRQRGALFYAKIQCLSDGSLNQDVINQSLICFISYKGFYQQVMQEMLGMIDNQEEYEGIFKPDSPSFSL